MKVKGKDDIQMSTMQRNLMYGVILLLPMIDILTTFTVMLPLSFGAAFRGGMTIILFIFLLRYYIRKGSLAGILYSIPFCFILTTFIVNAYTKHPFLFTDELIFLLKTAFFLLIIYLSLFINDRTDINNSYESFLYIVNINSVVITLSFWAAILTRTSLKSYPYQKLGYSGWYFAANELSVIVLVLLACSLIFFSIRPSWIRAAVIFSLLTVVPMIGTKTAFFGAILIITVFVIVYLSSLQHRLFMFVIPTAIFYSFFLAQSPAIENLQPEQVVREKGLPPVDQQLQQTNMLSSRDAYLEQTKLDYINATFSRKLFGLGYGGDYKTAPKTIEMDFYELFFSYGIVGGTFIILLLLTLSIKLVTFTLVPAYTVLAFTYLLCLGIAFVVGHVFFAPSVMSYLFILIASIFFEKRRLV